MVSSFANYVFRAPPAIGRGRSRQRPGVIRRVLRSHWLLEPLVLCAVLGVLVVGASAADLETLTLLSIRKRLSRSGLGLISALRQVFRRP